MIVLHELILNPMYRILIAAALFLLSACSKSGKAGPDEPQQPQGPPLSTPRGTPIGPIASATIGAQGGQLINADGSVKVIVPAGALTANQTFSIQSVENILRSSKTASRSFRLLPENIIFSKPVAVVMKYDPDDITTGLEDVMRVAYQTPQGQWKATNAALDKNAHTLTAYVRHFCDFTFYEQFELFASKNIALAGDKVQLRVGVIATPSDYEAGSMDELLAPEQHLAGLDLTKNNYYEQVSKDYISKVLGWKNVTGIGTLTPQVNGYGLKANAEYTAPAQVAQPKDVIVEVSLEGSRPIPDTSAPGGKRPLGQLIIRKTIRLMPQAWATATFDGKDYTLNDGHRGLAANGLSALAAYDNAQGASFSLTFGDMLRGTYGPGAVEPNTSKMVLTFNHRSVSGTPVIAQTTYCQMVNDKSVQKFSNGILTITQYGDPGDFIEGEWKGSVYQLKPGGQACDYESKPLEIKFRIKRQS